MKTSKKQRRTSDEKKSLTTLGDNLRRVRLKRKYSQEEFAHLAGFSRSYYTEIETGKRNLSLLNLIKIAEALDVDVRELLDLTKGDSDAD
jgi:transcriptional regulator with XRE-family HTH domain